MMRHSYFKFLLAASYAACADRACSGQLILFDLKSGRIFEHQMLQALVSGLEQADDRLCDVPRSRPARSS
jgi:hypothetical protein